jgi:hypothetical protein
MISSGNTLPGMKFRGLPQRRALRVTAGVAAVLLAVTLTGWSAPTAQASGYVGYPNPDCTIPPYDYYDFCNDCAAYTNWGIYIPDGCINSGPWSVDLPTALGDTIAAVSYNGEAYCPAALPARFHDAATSAGFRICPA